MVFFGERMRRHFVTPQRATGKIRPGIADPDHDENAHQKPCAAVQKSQRDHVQRQPGAEGVDERQIHHLRQPGARIGEDRLRHHQHIDNRKDEAQLLRHKGVDSERHQHVHEAENEKAPLQSLALHIGELVIERRHHHKSQKINERRRPKDTQEDDRDTDDPRQDSSFHSRPLTFSNHHSDGRVSDKRTPHQRDHRAEIRPVGVGDPEFCVGHLPEQKIAQPQLTGGTDQEIRIWLAGGVEMVGDGILVDLLRREFARRAGARNLLTGVARFPGDRRS